MKKFILMILFLSGSVANAGECRITLDGFVHYRGADSLSGCQSQFNDIANQHCREVGYQGTYTANIYWLASVDGLVNLTVMLKALAHPNSNPEVFANYYETVRCN